MFFFFKQKTAYEMRISDWSSDVCSSDLHHRGIGAGGAADHVLEELAVARRVDDDVVAQRRPEPNLGGVAGHRLVALGLEGVEHEGPLDRNAAARRNRLPLGQLDTGRAPSRENVGPLV